MRLNFADEGFLTVDETRRGLAQIWRCRLGDLLDDEGMIIVEKVKALPAWCIGKFKIIETSHVRGKHNPTRVTWRTYQLELTDKLRAVQADNELRGDAPPPTDDEPAEVRIARRNRAMAMLRAFLDMEGTCCQLRKAVLRVRANLFELVGQVATRVATSVPFTM